MHHFRKYLTREEIFTIPNFMSMFRLVLLPFVIWAYWKMQYDIAAGLVLLSALTDILDGVIARKFDMVSDLGKMLDPICDKLTQAVLLICLVTRYSYVWIVFGLLAAKELSMLVLGGIAVKRRETVHSAKWYGKLCTVVLEGVMIVLILFHNIPEPWAILMLTLCSAVMVFSLIMYAIFFLRLILFKD